MVWEELKGNVYHYPTFIFLSSCFVALYLPTTFSSTKPSRVSNVLCDPNRPLFLVLRESSICDSSWEDTAIQVARATTAVVSVPLKMLPEGLKRVATLFQGAESPNPTSVMMLHMSRIACSPSSASPFALQFTAVRLAAPRHNASRLVPNERRAVRMRAASKVRFEIRRVLQIYFGHTLESESMLQASSTGVSSAFIGCSPSSLGVGSIEAALQRYRYIGCRSRGDSFWFTW